jgi:hypothetical protein
VNILVVTAVVIHDIFMYGLYQVVYCEEKVKHLTFSLFDFYFLCV